jgi:Fur family transcriptional regulator, ferric uptake regulator
MAKAALVPIKSEPASFGLEALSSLRTNVQIARKRYSSPQAKNGQTHVKTAPAVKATGIEARCAATGMRMTEQRRVIARVLAEAADHPDVEELYRRCVAVDDKISISTVYRTVKLFEDAGIIERHDFREGRARYEQMRDNHHDHLINLRDGKVIEFTSEEIEQLQAEIARKLGFRLVDHRLELYCVPLDDDKS